MDRDLEKVQNKFSENKNLFEEVNNSLRSIRTVLDYSKESYKQAKEKIPGNNSERPQLLGYGERKIAININTLIERSKRAVHNLYPDAEIKPDYGKHTLVFCKPTEVTQVLTNIIKNASEAYDAIQNRDKVILIKSYVSKEDKHTIVEIEDEAGGIDDAIKDKIWEVGFTTKHKTEKEIVRGQGLSIVKEIMKNYQGLEIISPIVKNGKEINGTKFILKFKHV